MSTEKKGMEIDEIMKVLAHRYPFLLVDRILEMDDKRVVGIKNVTINEPFFQGHFPGQPVMPGVLIIEAMAQTSAVLVVRAMGPEAARQLVYFMSIENARFRKPVTPGDQLRIHVMKERSRGAVWRFSGAAKVDGKLVAEATYTAMLVDRA